MTRPKSEIADCANYGMTGLGSYLDGAQSEFWMVRWLQGRGEQICHEASVRYGLDLPIAFAFISADHFQAAAFGTYRLVAVCMGCVAKLVRVFSLMLRSSAALQDLGAVHLEVGNQSGIPRCPVRQLIAQLLTRVAFDFLVAHEVAHILRQHGAVLNPGTAELRLDEDRGDQGSINDQALEADADHFAVVEALERAAGMGLHLARGLQFPPFMLLGIQAAFSTVESAMRMTMIAVWTFARLLKSTTESKDLSSLTHPPLGIRCVLFMTAAVATVTQRYGELHLEEQAATRAVTEAISAAEHALQVAPDLNLPPFNSGHEEVMISHGARIMETRAALEPRVRALQLSDQLNFVHG